MSNILFNLLREIVHITNQFKGEVKVSHVYSWIRNAKINLQIDAKLIIIHK